MTFLFTIGLVFFENLRMSVLSYLVLGFWKENGICEKFPLEIESPQWIGDKKPKKQ